MAAMKHASKISALKSCSMLSSSIAMSTVRSHLVPWVAVRTISIVVEFRIRNAQGIPGVESIIAYQRRHTFINITRSIPCSSSTTSRNIMESISAGEASGRGSATCGLHSGWVGALGSLNERAFETSHDLPGASWRMQWRRQESGRAEQQTGTDCRQERACPPSASLNSWVDPSTQRMT